MPAKVFRLHTTGTQLLDWSVSSPIGSASINTIPNPTGLTASQQITSIPSPFARMDLVKSAFQHLTNPLESITGNTIYHRLVSEALDLAQIMFDYPRFSKQGVELLVWDKANDLGSLLHGGDNRHSLLGNSLNLFLKQDSASYNFDKLNRLYIIKYNFKVIGGTSPATLFFSAANNIGTINLPLGNHMAFDPANFTPLFMRSDDFQQFIYHYFAYVDAKQNGLFSQHLAEFSAYLRRSLNELQRINPTLHAAIQGLIANPISFINQYQPLAVDQANNILDIIGQPYYKSAGLSPAIIAQTSNFILQSPHCTASQPPLVLANGVNITGLIYFSNVRWNPSITVPYKDPQTDLDKRQLPGQVHQYPYLTVSDFLEPYLVSIPYKLNQDFATNALNDDSTSYLLPLTSRFFEFFDASDLSRSVYLTLQAINKQEVKVLLRLPIKQGFITFERTYKRPVEGEIQFKHPYKTGYMEGEIVEWSLTMLIYPFFRFPSHVSPHYRVMLIDTLKQAGNATLSFFQVGNTLREVLPSRTVQRSDKENMLDAASTHFSVLSENFDLVQVELPFFGETVTATILPAWPAVLPGAARFRVAVDFGTTNTHIEYKVDNKPEKAFDIVATDEQTGSLHIHNQESVNKLIQVGLGDLINPIVKEFIPFRIGGAEPYFFPTRTALNEPKGLNLNQPTEALADLTLPFFIERDLTPVNSTNTLNLKWSKMADPSNQVRVNRYIDFLLLLIRNKVLRNGGDLNQTEIVWFYPSSMTAGRLSLFAQAWDRSFQKYINKASSPTRQSESLAPFYYYRNTQKVVAISRPAVSVDIGGGTTDLVLFVNNEPTTLSSFKCASNAIYGDGYNGQPANNGFVKKYKPIIAKYLADNNLTDLESLLDDMDSQSSDIVSFFFSLSDHPDVRSKGIPLSFSGMLSDDGYLKMILLLYYVALFYHIAKLMHSQGLDSPQYITFSGNGSKLTGIIDPDPSLANLKRMTRLIFDYVYDLTCPPIELKQTANPKEITCKGGLSAAAQSMVDINELKTVLTGNSSSEVIKGNLTGLTYDQIISDKPFRQEVIEEVKKLAQLLTSLNKKIKLTDTFSIDYSALQLVIKLLNDQDLLLNSYQAGLDERLLELGQQVDSVIDETLFFYPLIGVLNEAAEQVVS